MEGQLGRPGAFRWRRVTWSGKLFVGRGGEPQSKRHVGSPGVQGKPPGCVNTNQVNGGVGVEILCQRNSGQAHHWPVLLIHLFLVDHILTVMWTRVVLPIHWTYPIVNMVTISNLLWHICCCNTCGYNCCQAIGKGCK